ncbi:NADH:flavin oxidoreductase/NADH oxidase [Strigomonas culicis]|nr:NADH:flavin oxidoreductase/NADH oxidase [Strigomonas culicis]EPY32006.1 NADH:flavin oxidoreductase/NADH oxidase [Strigomonas culicis]|eukprot:EPY19576.1 NADH:flavin oxidoreductase/NADH oxidase [Strigomonas culicis]
MSKVDALLKPLQIGKLTLANRFVMAPLTRCRATADHVPTDAMVKYYSDRASFGLILSEATQIQDGYSTFGFEGGIYGDAQVAGWRKVTDAVHAKGGVIFCQLHHGGRAAVPCNLRKELQVVSATTVGILNHKCPGGFAQDGETQPYPAEVHELTPEEIQVHVQLYATAAKNAIAAGFDGVEIHGANGYLIDQFLRDGCNKRTDAYGGSIEKRSRFLLEVVDAVVAAVGADRVGLRISPLNGYNNMSDSDPEALTRYVCKALNSRKLAFLDVLRGDFFTPATGADKWAREAYEGTLFTGMGFELEEAERTVAAKAVDAVVFGTKAIANPDLVARATAGAELNTLDPNTFYTHDDAGYNDYATLA